MMDRYRLDEKVLDDGAGETIHRGWDTKLARRVTIRQMSGEQSAVAEREARILGGLAHPVMLELFELVTEADPPFMVFGALDGVDLRSWVERNGAAKWGDVQGWLGSILDALVLAHSHGFVHHDLRPEVVFVDTGLGTTQLLGFGRTRVIGGSSSTVRDRMTPPEFWAPELFAADEIDLRSDLYGAGAVAYFALTGRAPVELDPSAGMAAGLQRLLHDEIRPPSDFVRSIPEELDVLVMRALERDPAARFQSAHDMRAAVDELSGVTLPIAKTFEPVPLSVGEVVDGRYEIKARLGSGGMSRVFLARDVESERSVALKSLRSTLATSHEALVREAEALGKVLHLNVVDVFGVGSFRGAPYLVLEHLPGQTVSDELRRHRGELPRWFALATLNQIGRGLTAVHEAGLVHGDVKPGNVIVGPGGRVSLVDFGLVRDPRTYRADRVAGTPAYLAPERLRGEIDTQLAHRIDVYALAVMAYEMLVGRRPFRESTAEQLMAAQLWSEPPPPSKQRPGLEWADDIILAGLNKDPRDRTASAEDFVRDLLEAALDAEPERRFRLLLADDEDAFAEFAHAALEANLPGLEWTRAADGAEACSLIENDTFDAVLIDLDMPVMNGFELAAHVRASMSAPPPTACMTAVGDKPDLQLLAALGIRGFLTKPVHPEEMACLVMRLLEIGDAQPVVNELSAGRGGVGA